MTAKQPDKKTAIQHRHRRTLDLPWPYPSQYKDVRYTRETRPLQIHEFIESPKSQNISDSKKNILHNFQLRRVENKKDKIGTVHK